MKRIIVIFTMFLVVGLAFFLASCSHLPSGSGEGPRIAAFRLPGESVNDGPRLSPQNNINTQDAFQELAVDMEDDDILLLIRQWELLLQFMEEESMVRTYRRGLLLDRMEDSITPPSFYDLYGHQWNCIAIMALDLTFTVGRMCQNYRHNERLLTALLEFSELCEDFIRIDVVREMASGMHPTRQSLTPSELIFLEALEAYMDIVNIPFWYDMYTNDPVITHIGLPSPNSPGGYNFFTIWLYDLSYIPLCNNELAVYTMDLRKEITEFIGMDTYRFEFRVNRCEGIDMYDTSDEDNCSIMAYCNRRMDCSTYRQHSYQWVGYNRC
ncbi:MAG: hypothetical protein FWC73_08815 [Defluviitaleaceae bacterium]|nr:hypothetical protein [Defluviitaleaceae bacterium]